MMLILPVLTLTLIELGYILRITRASMVEVMKSPYIRTAFLKGLPYKKVVFKHAVKNALIAPITVIMLHVNWLLGELSLWRWYSDTRDSGPICWNRHCIKISTLWKPVP